MSVKRHEKAHEDEGEDQKHHVKRSMSRMKCLKVTIPAKAPGRRDIGTYQEVVEPMEHKK